MILNIPYGKDGGIEAAIDDARVAGVIEPNEVEIGDEAATIREALAHPYGYESLAAFLKGAKDVLFIVNDPTRPTPTARVLDFIEKDIEGYPVSFIVATGAHRAPTHEEYIQIFSEKHYRKHKDRIFVHDAKKGEDMVYLGTSKNGTEMRVNRRGVEADRIVIISSVEPHYFAGYTGGRKSFLPGIAAHETITQNHKLALKREACALRLEGNPVHEDMIDALGTVKKEVFAINTVLDKHHRIYAAVAGDVHQSLDPAISKANDVFVAEIPEKCDIVVSVVKFPSDIDLYQAQKGIDNAKYALKEGGVLLLVAKCRMGVGDDSFVKLLSSASSPADALKKIEQGFVLGYHKAAKMAEVGLSAEVWAVTDLDPALLESIFIKPFASLQEALDAALAKKGPDAKALVLLDGSLTIPQVKALV
ncbi:MAG: nickel-dependent lactate racemase [Acidobacteriota bacterium]|jgi:nickel-dependent lactate racemase|nr:nickel-dependent lactate racemase [Acidobacteriota bacterium]